MRVRARAVRLRRGRAGQEVRSAPLGARGVLQGEGLGLGLALGLGFRRVLPLEDGRERGATLNPNPAPTPLA